MPARRKNESLEEYRARSRDYMERRAIARGGQPIRRVGRPSLPTPHAPARRMVFGRAPKEWQRRQDYRETVGLYPERLKGIADDGELVRAMRKETAGATALRQGRAGTRKGLRGARMAHEARTLTSEARKGQSGGLCKSDRKGVMPQK